MGGQDLAHLIADTHRRMECGRWLLIDQCDAFPPNALKRSKVRLKNVRLE